MNGTTTRLGDGVGLFFEEARRRRAELGVNSGVSGQDSAC